MSLVELWPLFALRIRTARLELRLLTDEDAAALASLAAAGVHPLDEMPFVFPWTRAESPALERSTLQYFWGTRAQWRPEQWSAGFAVRHDGEVIGSQGVSATDFAVTRSVGTGSWLGQRFQGKGLGTEMRAAVLHFAFAGLGALEARSGAFVENAASVAVSRKLGYVRDGTATYAVEGVRRVEQRFLLTRERWEATERIPVEIEGLEACRSLFGTG